MGQRSALNATTGDLENLARLAAVQREIEEIANALYFRKTSRRQERQDLARRLNAVKASVRTVELRLGEAVRDVE